MKGATCLGHGGGVSPVDPQLGPLIPVDAEQAGLDFPGDRAARGGRFKVDLTRDGAKGLAGDEVEHPLIGGETVLERRLLGQDVDPQYGLGGQVPQFGKSGNAGPIEKNDGGPAAGAAPSGLGLGRQLGDEFGDIADPEGLDLGLVEAELRTDVAHHPADGVRRSLHDQFIHQVVASLGLGSGRKRGEGGEDRRRQGGQQASGHGLGTRAVLSRTIMDIGRGGQGSNAEPRDFRRPQPALR